MSVELPVSNTALAQHVNYASNMTDRIYIQNCAAIFSRLTQYTVDVFSVFSFFSYNLERRIPNPAYPGRCDGGQVVFLSATQAPHQIVVFSKV